MAHNLSTTFNPHDVARSKVPSLPYRSREGGGLRPRKRSSAQMEMEGKATEWDYVDVSPLPVSNGHSREFNLPLISVHPNKRW